MQLWILRHGRAEPFQDIDASRALVTSGRQEVRHMVTQQRHKMPAVSEVWVSPYVRARQTAAIAREALGGLSARCEQVSELLLPEARVSSLIEALYQSGLDSVLLVSHQPLESTLLDVLCGPAETHYMQTASLAAVELEVVAAGMGRLQWLEHP